MKRTYRFYRQFLFFCCLSLVASLLLIACEQIFLSKKETVFLHFPPIPPHVPEYACVTGWQIVYPDQNGKLISITKSVTEESVSLVFTKNTLTPVLTFPLCGKTQFYKPAGALYPLNMQPDNERELQTSWESGFTAHFALNLLMKADQPFEQARQAAAFINWRRFDEQVRKHKNPWKLNEVKLYQAIESAELTARSFSRLAVNRIKTILPEHIKTLVPEYLPEKPVIIPTDGIHTELTLVPGVNRFVTTDSVLSVFHDKNGSNTLVITETPR